MISDVEFKDRIEKVWPKFKEKQLINKTIYKKKIKSLLKEKNICLIAHYYVNSDIQELAEETGGMLGDSLAMARFGKNHPSKKIVVAGVKFMGETAKILSYNKKIIMPTLKAECSLDLSCKVNEFKHFISLHPNRTVVVYVNTSAAIKALADWTVTSSNALKICSYLNEKGKKIIWAPDKYLGSWIEDQTGADIIKYNGACIVHEEFKANELLKLKKEYPDAAILVHPESPKNVIEIADVIGSTSQLLSMSTKLSNPVFIVATEIGILYKMKKYSPNKIFIQAPTMGKHSSCKACARCPWMGMNTLENLLHVLEHEDNEIIIPENICNRAMIPLNKMVTFNE